MNNSKKSEETKQPNEQKLEEKQNENKVRKTKKIPNKYTAIGTTKLVFCIVCLLLFLCSMLYFCFENEVFSFSKNSKNFIDSRKNNYDQNWHNVIPNEETRKLIGSIINSQYKLRKYRRKNAQKYSSSNMIFYGSPGTGKSYCASVIAQNFSSFYATIPAGSLQQLYVGSGSKKWTSIIEEARENLSIALKGGSDRPVIIIVEEIDSLAKKGKEKVLNAVDDTLINTFLESVDSISNNNDNILIIGTTNYINLIEDAAKRAGRFQKIRFDGPQDETTYSFLIDNVKKKINLQYFVLQNENELNLNLEKKTESKNFFVIIEESFWSALKSEIFKLSKEKEKFFNFAEIYDSVEKNIIFKRENLEKEVNIFLYSSDVNFSTSYLEKEFLGS